MISIKNYQFTRVKTGISSICANCGTLSENEAPTALPYLSFTQKDNPTYRQTRDSGSNENHVQPMVQIEVYTSKTNSTMYQCEQIFNKADEIMINDGWTRITGPIPSSKTHHSLTARYQAVVGQNAPNDFTVYNL